MKISAVLSEFRLYLCNEWINRIPSHTLRNSYYKYFMGLIYNKFELNSIRLEVLGTNDRAIHLYNKLGFKNLGILPEKIKRNGQVIDVILMEHTR